MDLLLASLLLSFSDTSQQHSDLNFEQMVQAALNSQKAVVQGADPVTDIGAAGEEVVKADPQPDAPVVKGIYMTAYTTSVKRFNTLIQLLDETELNAVVVDIKEDKGYITFDTGNPELAKYGTTRKIIPDTKKMMDTFQAHDIYPIARIVVFKDTLLAKSRPELSFKNPDGSVWANNKSEPESFVNPYMKEVWDYNIAVAKEAAKLGFKEIQFDYVRFPEGFEKKADKLKYTKDERERIEVVGDFVEYAREQLSPLGVRVSVDIFGYAASVPAAEGIGQDFNTISQYVDVICPMVYPSHYSTGWFDQKVPDAKPYETIDGAMKDTHTKLSEIGKLKPIIRPWIQDFTAPWIPGHIKYTKKEVEAQIRALQDNGIEEFLLWNSSNVYSPGTNYDLK